jgi:hypothetical protein
MKTTVKKNLIVFHKPHEWETIHLQLRADYGDKIMISYVCRRELGFTVRHHKGLAAHDAVQWELMKEEGWTHRYHYEEQVHLDFYNEAQQTWFVLKYLNL